VNWWRRWEWWLVLASAVLFLAWPQLDLIAAAVWYDPQAGFYAKNAWWVQLSYETFKYLHLYVFFGLLWLWVASRIWVGRPEAALRRRFAYLLLVMLVGPGLLVNGIFKAEWGRARPHQVVEFGGDKTFTPAILPADQCAKNCSFVSGHASMGFYLIALAWVFRDRRWLWAGVLLGAYVGLGRMAQGGHFLSDVVFSFWSVYLAAAVCARWLLGYWGITPPARPAD
jgi:lipid A 4'-phosphatase